MQKDKEIGLFQMGKKRLKINVKIICNIYASILAT